MSRLSMAEQRLSALSRIRHSAPAWLTTPCPNRCPSPTGSGSAMATPQPTATVSTTPADNSARRMSEHFDTQGVAPALGFLLPWPPSRPGFLPPWVPSRPELVQNAIRYSTVDDRTSRGPDPRAARFLPVPRLPRGTRRSDPVGQRPALAGQGGLDRS